MQNTELDEQQMLAALEAAIPTDWPAAYQELVRYSDLFPLPALIALRDRYEEWGEHLVAELQACADDPADRAAEEGNWMLHIYALQYVAAMRDERAFAPLLHLTRLDGETLEMLLGDHLTESLPRALAATCPTGGELQLQQLAEQLGFLWARSAAQRALVLRVLHEEYPREALITWAVAQGEAEAARMLAAGLEGELNDEAGYLTELVETLEEVGAAEQLELVQSWYRQKLLDETIQRFEGEGGSKERLQRDFASCRADELDHGWGYPTRETVIDEIARWSCFDDDYDPEAEDEEAAEPVETFRRDSPKVGRNDPCPCGSGKKYKKCCGAAA